MAGLGLTGRVRNGPPGERVCVGVGCVCLDGLQQPHRRKPEAVFRIGFVSASVFVHEVGTDNCKRSICSVNLQKRYKDGDDVRYTSSFGLAELPQVLRVLQLAQQYVESREAKLELND